MTRLLVFLVVLAAILAAGCLPSGTRGEGTGLFGSGSTGSAAPSVSPAPTGPTPRPSFVPPTPTPEPTFLAYVVKKGDSLNTIAHRFKTTARSIAFWNRATYPSLDPESAKYQPNLLKLGWTLLLRPNDVVDEQELPEPSSSADDTTDPEPADTEPSDSAIAE
jgi:LysM domain